MDRSASSPNLAIHVWSGEGEIPHCEISGLKKAQELPNTKGLLLALNKVESKEKIKIKKIEDWLLENKSL